MPVFLACQAGSLVKLGCYRGWAAYSAECSSGMHHNGYSVKDFRVGTNTIKWTTEDVRRLSNYEVPE